MKLLTETAVVLLANSKRFTFRLKDHGHNLEVLTGTLTGHMFPHRARAREAVQESENNAQG